MAVWGRGEGTLTAALAAGAAAYLLAWLAGAAIGDPTFRTRRAVPDSRHLRRRRCGGPAGEQTSKKAPDARPPIRKPVRRK